MFILTKENLDKRICDVEGSANEETFREYIRNSENEFGLHPKELDIMDDEELNGYLNFIDYLWEK